MDYATTLIAIGIYLVGAVVLLARFHRSRRLASEEINRLVARLQSQSELIRPSRTESSLERGSAQTRANSISVSS